jgi:hypothetical protein
VCGKLRPKPVENKGKILPDGPLAVRGLRCSIGRGGDACCHDPSTTVGPVESFGTQKARLTGGEGT